MRKRELARAVPFGKSHKGSVAPSAKSVKLRDVQEDLDDYMNDLGETVSRANPNSGETSIIDVASMFAELVERKFHAEACWLENLAVVRIPTLRRFAYYASGFGLDELAELILQHITIRKAK